MRCAKCHKNEASIEFTPVVDGKAQKPVPLCKDCAAPASAKRIEAFYRRVTPQEFARLQGDSKVAESFFDPSLEDLLAHSEKLRAGMQEQESSVRGLCVGPYWHALHFLLTGDGDLRPHSSPRSPLGNVVHGGTETQWASTYGHVRSVTPDEVCEAAAALGKIAVEELRSRFSVASFNLAQIYRRGGRACWTDEDAEPLFKIYPRVVELFQSAARDGDMILLSSG